MVLAISLFFMAEDFIPEMLLLAVSVAIMVLAISLFSWQ
jgi:hypothetical protein